MVGDRRHDVDGAAAHGIDAVVVGWGYGQDDFADADRPSAAMHVGTVEELRRTLGV
jgi:phosphoglycolate phosphatase-like HAD superfamily hydrolase